MNRASSSQSPPSSSQSPTSSQDVEIINNSDLTQGRRLGAGAYGKVRCGGWNRSGQSIDVAIKIFHYATDSTFENEVAIMRSVRHPHVVLLHGYSIDESGRRQIVMERLSCNLTDRLTMQPPLENLECERVALDIALGLNALHEREILHRDLKSSNILLDENNRAKLADFGMSRIAPPNCDASNTFGHDRWAAPEILSNPLQPSFSYKSDIYSMGMVFWEILTRKFPYSNLFPLAGTLKEKILAKPQRDLPPGRSAKLKEATQMIWGYHPDDRRPLGEVIDYLESRSDHEVAMPSLELFDDIKTNDNPSSYVGTSREPFSCYLFGVPMKLVYSKNKSEELAILSALNIDKGKFISSIQNNFRTVPKAAKELSLAIYAFLSTFNMYSDYDEWNQLFIRREELQDQKKSKQEEIQKFQESIREGVGSSNANEQLKRMKKEERKINEAIETLHTGLLQVCLSDRSLQDFFELQKQDTWPINEHMLKAYAYCSNTHICTWERSSSESSNLSPRYIIAEPERLDSIKHFLFGSIFAVVLLDVVSDLQQIPQSVRREADRSPNEAISLEDLTLDKLQLLLGNLSQKILLLREEQETDPTFELTNIIRRLSTAYQKLKINNKLNIKNEVIDSLIKQLEIEKSIEILTFEDVVKRIDVKLYQILTTIYNLKKTLLSIQVVERQNSKYQNISSFYLILKNIWHSNYLLFRFITMKRPDLLEEISEVIMYAFSGEKTHYLNEELFNIIRWRCQFFKNQPNQDFKTIQLLKLFLSREFELERELIVDNPLFNSREKLLEIFFAFDEMSKKTIYGTVNLLDSDRISDINEKIKLLNFVIRELGCGRKVLSSSNDIVDSLFVPKPSHRHEPITTNRFSTRIQMKLMELKRAKILRSKEPGTFFLPEWLSDDEYIASSLHLLDCCEQLHPLLKNPERLNLFDKNDSYIRRQQIEFRYLRCIKEKYTMRDDERVPLTLPIGETRFFSDRIRRDYIATPYVVFGKVILPPKLEISKEIHASLVAEVCLHLEQKESSSAVFLKMTSLFNQFGSLPWGCSVLTAYYMGKSNENRVGQYEPRLTRFCQVFKSSEGKTIYRMVNCLVNVTNEDPKTRKFHIQVSDMQDEEDDEHFSVVTYMSEHFKTFEKALQHLHDILTGGTRFIRPMAQFGLIRDIE